MNREPLFECDGGCECTFHEEDLRCFNGLVLCEACYENDYAVFESDEFSDLDPFKSPHLTRGQGGMSFEDYWNQYGELHASFCGGNIKAFAREIWASAQGNGGNNGRS